MGLRFRKSISLIPGVRLNFGKTGMSISAGVPGFRTTYHTSGKRTISVGIPGTGLYYVDTINPRTQHHRNDTHQEQPTPEYTPVYYSPLEQPTAVESTKASAANSIDTENQTQRQATPLPQIDRSTLCSIHKSSDDTIEWTEVLVSPDAPNASYNQQAWQYYHQMASRILSGDIDAYLQLIYEVNPLDDLLAYGGQFEFGTDDPQKMEVEFVVNVSALSSTYSQLNCVEYNRLLQEYVCSVCIRVARDMFALLPISNAMIHAVIDDLTIVSVDFDRDALAKVKIGFIDPVILLSKFRNNMEFSHANGFSPVDRM